MYDIKYLIDVVEMFKAHGQKLYSLKIVDTDMRFEGKRGEDKILYLSGYYVVSKGTIATVYHTDDDYKYETEYQLTAESYMRDDYDSWTLIHESKRLIEKEVADDES